MNQKRIEKGQKKAEQSPHVAVVGAGFGGLAATKRLLKEGAEVRIFLIEGAGRILPDLPGGLSRSAARTPERKGVHVRVGMLVERYDGTSIEFGGTNAPLASKTLVSTGGIKALLLVANTVARDQLETGANGRVRVRDTLQLPEHPEVFVIGDSAFLETGDGPLPMVAPAAVQTAEMAARNIGRSMRGLSPRSLSYRDPGSLATVGRNAAVASIGAVKFRGFAAWLVWLIVHLMRLFGFRNRLIVLIDWMWDYFFYERASRFVFLQYLRDRDFRSGS